MLNQSYMSRGFKAGDTKVIIAFTFLRPPVAALLGFVLLDELPEIWVWLSADIIAKPSLVIARRELVMAKEEKNSKKA